MPAHPPRLTGTVLIAEDNPLNQQVVRAMVESTGCRAVVVADGAAAVERSAAGGIDLVLMDVMMPMMDGVDATRAIRRDEQRGGRPRLIIIALTAVIGERQRCLDAGMDEFLTKPIAPAALWAALAARLPSGPPEDDAIDQEQLAQLAQLGTRKPGFLADLLGRFLSSLPGQVERIRRAVDTGDISGARAAAHQLGSASGYVGARQVLRDARAIEQAARDADAAALRRHLAALERSAPATAERLKDAAGRPG
jgi:CheY-like chemotaxis protein